MRKWEEKQENLIERNQCERKNLHIPIKLDLARNGWKSETGQFPGPGENGKAENLLFCFVRFLFFSKNPIPHYFCFRFPSTRIGYKKIKFQYIRIYIFSNELILFYFVGTKFIEFTTWNGAGAAGTENLQRYKKRGRKRRDEPNKQTKL